MNTDNTSAAANAANVAVNAANVANVAVNAANVAVNAAVANAAAAKAVANAANAAAAKAVANANKAKYRAFITSGFPLSATINGSKKYVTLLSINGNIAKILYSHKGQDKYKNINLTNLIKENQNYEIKRNAKKVDNSSTKKCTLTSFPYQTVKINKITGRKATITYKPMPYSSNTQKDVNLNSLKCV